VNQATHSAPQAQIPSGEDRRSVALVTTTIRTPRFLEGALENADRYGHLPRLRIIVVGDRKTPGEVGGYVSQLGRRYGVDVVYLDIAAQRRFLRRWPSLDLFLRYDSIQRRNVGYLIAAEGRAEVIITVDDDNFVTEEDFIGGHAIVGRQVSLPVVSHPSGWWNVCERLTTNRQRRFYPRGFPKSAQDWKTGPGRVTAQEVRIIANGGLWLGAPDVDATAHIEEPIEVTGLEPLGGNRTCALAPGTWCPLNSQNTAFDASVLPAMYLPVMHDWIRGSRISRMDDIWMSYFLRAIADLRGESVAYGPPLVIQERNPHNFLNDLSEELPGYVLTEHIAGYLRRFHSDSATYADAYLDLIYHLRESTEDDSKIDISQREYLRTLTLGMAAWLASIKEIAPPRS
jgi:hypothetical protein